MTDNALTKFEQSKPKVAKEHKWVTAAIARIESFELESDADFGRLETGLAEFKDHHTDFKAFRDMYCNPLRRVADAASAFFKGTLDRFKDGEKTAQAKLNDWERKKEKEAFDRKVELQRLQDEETRKTKEAAEEAAKKAVASGDQELAEEIREEAAQPPMPVLVLPARVPKTEAVQRRVTYKSEVDLREFCAAVLSGNVNVDYFSITPDMKMLNALARKHEGNNDHAPPGVTFRKETSYAAARK